MLKSLKNHLLAPALLGCGLAVLVALPTQFAHAQTDSEQEFVSIEIPSDPMRTYLDPAIEIVRNRVVLAWAGTDKKAKYREFMVCSASTKADRFGSIRMPFFGKAKHRVRQVALGNSHKVLGVLLQRKMSHRKNDYQILLSFSKDNGWSFSNPSPLDSYVASTVDEGSDIDIDGRRGTARESFAAAWSADANTVRATSIHLGRKSQTQAVSLGRHSSHSNKVEVACVGDEGIAVSFHDSYGISTAVAQPFTGGVEKEVTHLPGKFGELFSSDGHHRGPGYLSVFSGDKGRPFNFANQTWKAVSPILSNPKLLTQDKMEMALDGKNLPHYVTYDEESREVSYFGPRGQTQVLWTTKEAEPLSGLDITSNKDYLFITASTLRDLKVWRKKLP